jgi:hypothetical protein
VFPAPESCEFKHSSKPELANMQKYLPFAFALAVMLFSALAPLPAHAQNISDTGPGSFADIDNTGTLDYVLVNNGASIGNVTNDDAGKPCNVVQRPSAA